MQNKVESTATRMVREKQEKMAESMAMMMPREKQEKMEAEDVKQEKKQRVKS